MPAKRSAASRSRSRAASSSIAAPPGEWGLGVDTMSLPAGFSSADAQHVRLDRDAPLTIALTLRANRSISGRVPAGVTSIFVAPLGRSISVSPDGRFSIRSLPAGEITLRAKKGSREIAKRVTLPAEPVIVADLDLR